MPIPPINVNLPSVDLKPLTEFGEYVVERIYRATGVEARRILKEGEAREKTRLLKAETDAAILLQEAETQIELNEKCRSAALRMMHAAIREDDNIETITEKMLLLLPNEKPEGDGPSGDTINNIFDHGKKVSDNDMQSVWANLLAGEFAKPGSFSRQTINIVGDMETKDAQAFNALCRFVWQVEGGVPLIFSYTDPIYYDNGADFGTLSMLETLGLIHFDPLEMNQYSFGGVKVTNLGISYSGEQFIFTNQLKAIGTGMVRFTRAGMELFKICEVNPIHGFADYIIKAFKEKQGHDLARGESTLTL